MRGRVALALAAAAFGGGCGSEEKDGDAGLRDSAKRLAEVRSGELSMRFVISARGAKDADLGFAVKGPFALATEPGALPTSDLEYTQISGAQRPVVSFVSDPDGAWVVIDEQAYTLPADRTERLRARGGRSAGAAGLDGLRIDRWIEDPQTADGGTIDGVDTVRYSGRLRAGAALGDLFALGRRAGAKQLKRADTKTLEAADKNASITLHTGKEDGIPRRLELRASFPLKQPRDLGGELGQLEGAEVRFLLTLRRPGAKVQVRKPENPKPLSALAAG